MQSQQHCDMVIAYKLITYPEAHMIHNDEQLFTLTEIAKHFSLPESTARYYAKRFSQFLPYHGEGRRKRYEKQCFDIFSIIIQEMRSGKNAHAVENILMKNYDLPTEIIVPAISTSTHIQKTDHAKPSHNNYPEEHLGSNYALKLFEQQTEAMQSIANSLSVLANQQEEMRRLATEAKNATEENVRLRDEVSTLKDLLHTAELIHQDDLKQLHSWMGRLAKSYNKKTLMEENKNFQNDA